MKSWKKNILCRKKNAACMEENDYRIGTKVVWSDWMIQTD